jgi:hypothetical protein
MSEKIMKLFLAALALILQQQELEPLQQYSN